MRDGYGGAAQDAAARIRQQREAERRRIYELKNRFPYAGTSEVLIHHRCGLWFFLKLRKFPLFVLIDFLSLPRNQRQTLNYDLVVL